EELARLPEVDHAPPSVDRTGRMKDQPVRLVPTRVHVRVHFVELLLRDAGQLDADPYGHVSLSMGDAPDSGDGPDSTRLRRARFATCSANRAEASGTRSSDGPRPFGR